MTDSTKGKFGEAPMSAKKKIEDCPWDSGEFGEEEKFAKAADNQEELSFAVDESLGLQMISIRLPKGLIEDFKLLGKIHGLGYQPLMRVALQRFAEGEIKMVMRELAEKEMNKKPGEEPEILVRNLMDAA